MIVCTYEDRPDCVVGLKLLVLSLQRHCPDLLVHVAGSQHWPQQRPWFEKQKNVRWFEETVTVGRSMMTTGWGVKPGLLTLLLETGHESVLWLDADVLVMRDFRLLLPGDPRVLVGTEDFVYAAVHGSQPRSDAMGLRPGRRLRRTVNTALLRVHQTHLPLLAQWQQWCASDAFLQAQKIPLRDRPVHLCTDQDLLTGLLGSDQFESLSFHLLQPGRDIAHCVGTRGYRVVERLRNLGRGWPALVHALGPKPWRRDRNLFAELSPYCRAAGAYRDMLDEDSWWMEPQTPAGRVMKILALGNGNLDGLPVAILGMLRVWMQRLIKHG